MIPTSLRDVLSHFAVAGAPTKAVPFGSGLINDTYLCTFAGQGALRKYILQLMNTAVFSRPDLVMENVELVTAHIAGRLRAEGEDPDGTVPALMHTRDGATYYRDAAGAAWRMFHFIESGTVFDQVQDGKHAYAIGKGLGRFQRLLADLDPGKLHDTLPGFHHTPRCLAEYDAAVRSDPRGRAGAIAAEAGFVSRRRDLAPLLLDRLQSGAIPLRVVHNDPKVNNVMVRKDTGEALCMIDLDTVKPGIVHFDFGDCVRSATNRAGEDAATPAAAVIDLGLYEAIAAGYLSEAGAFLTAAERALLPQATAVITFELGIRFLTDYLQGDRYFKIAYPAHNLHRARVQFHLLESIEAAAEQMRSCIERLCRE